MATRSSVLAWRTPWTGEPGGLPPVGPQSRMRLSEHTDAHVCHFHLGSRPPAATYESQRDPHTQTLRAQRSHPRKRWSLGAQGARSEF